MPRSPKFFKDGRSRRDYSYWRPVRAGTMWEELPSGILALKKLRQWQRKISSLPFLLFYSLL